MVPVAIKDGVADYEIGFIPSWLDDADPRPAREQLHEHYGHGGGWDPFPGFKRGPGYALLYPGDPPQHPIAYMVLHERETIVMYHHGWVAIFQPDGAFEVCRMD